MDSIRFCLKSIFRKKLRSMLTIIGISIGVLSVVIISIIGEVGRTAMNFELNSMGIGGLYIRTDSDNEASKLTHKELQIVQENEYVEQATPLITNMTNIRIRGAQTQAMLWGIDSNANEIVSMNLLHGRLINNADIVSKRNVCVVEKNFANLVYKRDNIVGKKILIEVENYLQEFEIIGVVSSGGNMLQTFMSDIVPSFLYVPFTTVSRLSQNNTFNQMIVKLEDDINEEFASSNILSTLAMNTGIQDGFKIENLNQQKENLNSLLGIITMILSVIGGISLIVSGISIMTVMLVTVNERKREIGIKKSIGAKRSTILKEFLSEALLLSIIGSFLGATAGILLGAIGCSIIGVALSINFTSILSCVLFSIFIGVIFGVYPALKASGLRPVIALRDM